MRKCICICMCICICICICMWLYVYLYMYMYMYMPKARKPAQRFCGFFALWYVGGVGVGGCNNVLCLRYNRVSSVNTLHVTLHVSVALRWTHFMLRCTLLLYFGEHTSCYVAHFCCTSVVKLHVTLHTSVVLGRAHVMLRCTLLLCFNEHTSCYVANFCCTRVNTLHVTLHTSVLRWTHFILRCTRISLWTTPKANLQRLCAVSSEAAQRCLPILVQ